MKEASHTDPSADIMGTAMLDFIKGHPWEDIKTWTSVGGDDVLPLPYLFRSYEHMPSLEKKALELARGSVLDIGCGAGSHALWLQQQQIQVKAIDVSRGAIETCHLRGVLNAEVKDIWKLKGETYDTLLLLMNGMGICTRLEKLPHLLEHLKGMLKPGGQILADSSDLIYMYEPEVDPENEEEDHVSLPVDNYYGEVTFKTFYKNLESEFFPWLYIDFFNLRLYAEQAGLKCELVQEGDHYDYLARLTLK